MMKKVKSFPFLFLFGLVIGGVVGQVEAQVTEDRLIASDGSTDDRFGHSVSVNGDTIVVGAPSDDDGGSLSGSAYVFTSAGGLWTQQAKLSASDASFGDLFGWSVSVSANIAVVGAYHDDDAGENSGSAYVFTRVGDTWSQEAKLTATDAAAGDCFGGGVSVNGNTAIVGAWGDSGAGTNSGSAYVFTRTGDTWSQQAKLSASDAEAFKYFGLSVSVSGDTAVVGARGDDHAGPSSGSAYVFTRTGDTWSQQGKLVASDPSISDWFGYSVCVDGDMAVVGARYNDDRGSAYIFARTAGVWTQQRKLTAFDGIADDQFGVSVSISGNTAIAGAYGDDDAGSSSGSAYVFTLGRWAWSHLIKLSASDAASGDWFGYSVSVDGDTAVVGARNSKAAGSAYVYDLSRPSNVVEEEWISY